MGELNQFARVSFDCPIVQSLQQFALDVLAANKVLVSLLLKFAHTGVECDQVAAPGGARHRDTGYPGAYVVPTASQSRKTCSDYAAQFRAGVDLARSLLELLRVVRRRLLRSL